MHKTSSSLLLHALDSPSDDSDEEIKDEQAPDMTNFMSESIRDNVDTDSLTFLKSQCNLDLISKIEILTNGQGNCTDCFKDREGRITAALAFYVFHLRNSKKTVILLNNINSSSVPP